MSRPGSYSSQSYSPASRSGALKSQATSPSLDPSLDPRDQSAKTEEKDQMVGLNDKFVAFIDKVKHLEQQNKVLETRLRILKGQGDYKGKIHELVQEREADLLRQVEKLTHHHLKLKAELDQSQGELEDSKQKYEVELQKKMDLENEFVISKKDAENGQLSKIDLALDLEDSMEDLEFLRQGYQEEIKELESHVHNETVVVHGDSKRALDMDEIITSVKSQYQNMAARNRDEAEQWNHKKMDAMALSARKHEQEVHDVKKELAEMRRLIQRLTGELETLRKKKDSLEGKVEAKEAEGQNSLAVTRDNIAQLDEARRQAMQTLTKQIQKYQELMNLRMAMDIEIATYRKLLEGAEKRMNNDMCQ
ncbi:unnamed protein product [Lota lota]